MCDVMETVYFALSIELYLADIECLVITVITLLKKLDTSCIAVCV